MQEVFDLESSVSRRRNLFSKLHDEKIGELRSGFRCWKTNFRTEVCSCSGCLTVAMLWMKESIEWHAFPDFEMLEAKIASAVKRIIANQYC